MTKNIVPFWVWKKQMGPLVKWNHLLLNVRVFGRCAAKKPKNPVLPEISGLQTDHSRVLASKEPSTGAQQIEININETKMSLNGNKL